MKGKFFKTLLSACAIFTLISTSTVNASAVKKDCYVEKKGINIEYFGHASFGISDSKGMEIVTDPYDPTVGYTFPSISTKILTVSHDHFDHNYVAALKGYEQLIFASTGSFKNGDIKIKGIASWHDNVQGALRGPNTIYTYEINDIKVCHLGDLGEQLSKEQLKSIGKVDVLMIPVGGCFTIDSEEAIKVINSINPKVIIPMHYLTEASKETFGDYLAPVSDFISKVKPLRWQVENVDELTLTRQMLNKVKGKKVYVLNYN